VRPAVLVIAGSDSSGGAGIQADIKALDHMGVHGAAAVTCVTAQSSTRVRTIYPMSAGAVIDQATEVLREQDIGAVKCGMLYSEEVIRAVADLVVDRNLRAVVDPVLAATSGGKLVRDGGAAAYMRFLVPESWCVTPNAHEAEALTGLKARGPAGAARAARALVEAGARSAVVKGGHVAGGKQVIDTIAVARGRKVDVERIAAPRLPGEYHGAGCHFASLLSAVAAHGRDPAQSFRVAHLALRPLLVGAERRGRGPRFLRTPPQGLAVEPASTPARAAMSWALAESILDLGARLQPHDLAEVGMNFGYATPGARRALDVCAVDGRIVASQGRAVLAGPIRFGGSRHVARILLACAKEAPSVRAAANLRHGGDLERRARRARLRLATFDRADEPRSASRPTSTMSWGTRQAIRTAPRLPDLIADAGAPGKEPMVRVLGTSPADVVRKALRLLP
jgi:hydroxymethylpyrimidine/phosphomethylpyrimidine kinase